MTDTHYMSKKVRYYVISAGGKYGNTDLFHFKELEGAMEMFKFLQKGEAISVESESVRTFMEKLDSDGDNYTFKTYHYEDTQKSGFHLESRIVDLFTKEQIEEVEKIEAKKFKEAEAKKPKVKVKEKGVK